MRTTLPACPGNRTSRGFPRLALAVAAVLAVPAFLVGPAAAAPDATTSAAATVPATAAASAGTGRPVSSAIATQPAPAPTAPAAPTAKAAAPAPSSGEGVAGATTEPPRIRSARAVLTPGPGRVVCGGALTFGTVHSCRSIAGTQKNAWTFSTRANSDVLYWQLVAVSGVGLSAQVTGADGTKFCDLASQPDECRLGPAGSYTITVAIDGGSGTGAYTLSVESRRTPSTCGQLPEDVFSWALPGVGGTLPAGLAARCFTFDQPTGTKLFIAEPHLRDPGDLRAEIVDARHQRLCQSHYADADCTLSTSGPYRVFLEEIYGKGTAYTLRLPRISQAVGCAPLPLAAFGDPGAATGHGRLAPYERACHAFSTTTAGKVMVRLDPSVINWRLYDDAGQRICDDAFVEYCALPAAGRYTVLPWSGTASSTRDYQVAVTPMDRVDGCAAAVRTEWDQPTLNVRPTSTVQTNCHPFQGRAGDRMVTYTGPVEVTAWLVDQSGALICTDASHWVNGCVLPADGTYRVIWHPSRWVAESLDRTYQLQVRRLSDAVGCPTLVPAGYDTTPVVGGIRCRTLDVAGAGDYRLQTVDATNHPVLSWVYDREGRRVCLPERCTFPAAGRYTLVFEPQQVVENDVEHGAALLPWAPADCATASDTGWRDAAHRLVFQAAGQVNCLQLATPAGAHIVQSEPGGVNSDIVVVDATGTSLCDLTPLRGYSCGLTGQAPFFALLKGRPGLPADSYPVAFSRVDGPPACPVLPAETTVTAGADRFVACFSIPADQHGATGSFSWVRTGGTGSAKVSVFDSRGNRYCRPDGLEAEGTLTCSLPDGPLTVLLETDGQDATYRLTHRVASSPTG